MQDILIFGCFVLAGVLVYALTRPSRFQITRSIHIQSRPEKIFPLVNSFQQWDAWSPWGKIHSKLVRTYKGAPEGLGAVYAWRGNIGKGCMEIIESIPCSKIGIKLDLLAPFEAHNHVDFTLKKQADATQVTLRLHGSRTFATKLVGMFFSVENMLGRKYERGLVNMKKLAEQS